MEFLFWTIIRLSVCTAGAYAGLNLVQEPGLIWLIGLVTGSIAMTVPTGDDRSAV